jgi:hypothetical protein
MLQLYNTVRVVNDVSSSKDISLATVFNAVEVIFLFHCHCSFFKKCITNQSRSCFTVS